MFNIKNSMKTVLENNECIFFGLTGSPCSKEVFMDLYQASDDMEVFYGNNVERRYFKQDGETICSMDILD